MKHEVELQERVRVLERAMTQLALPVEALLMAEALFRPVLSDELRGDLQRAIEGVRAALLEDHHE